MDNARQRIVALLTLGLAPLLVSALPAFSEVQIFADGFESGDLSAWSLVRQQIPGSLGVTEVAALGNSSFGLEVAVSGQAFLVDRSPDSETLYRAEFKIDPASLRLRPRGQIDLLRLYASRGRHHVRVVLDNGQTPIPEAARPERLAIRLFVRGNRGRYEFVGGGLLNGSKESTVELIWIAASGRNATDGRVILSIDGTPVAQEPSVANGRLDVRQVALGAIAGRFSLATDSFYLDDFRSFRTLAP